MKCGRVLPNVFLSVAAKMFAWGIGIGRVEGEGIEFVVAYHRERHAGLYHRAGDVQPLGDLRAPVDEVAEEDRGAVRVTVDAGPLLVTEVLQQPTELVCVMQRSPPQCRRRRSARSPPPVESG